MPTPAKQVKATWASETGKTVSLKTWARNSAGPNGKNWLARKTAKLVKKAPVAAKAPEPKKAKVKA